MKKYVITLYPAKDTDQHYFSYGRRDGAITFAPGIVEKFTDREIVAYTDEEIYATMYAKYMAEQYPGIAVCISKMENVFQCTAGPLKQSTMSDKGLLPV